MSELPKSEPYYRVDKSIKAVNRKTKKESSSETNDLDRRNLKFRILEKASRGKKQDYWQKAKPSSFRTKKFTEEWSRLQRHLNKAIDIKKKRKKK